MKQYLFDMHTHILPAYDDGSESMGDSVEMAAISAASGVRTIVATPHSYLRDYRPGETLNEIGTDLAELNEAVAVDGIPVKILPGMEILVRENVADKLRSGEYITLNGTQYALVEFEFGENPGFMSDRLFEIEQAGYTPVIAHPERYDAVKDDNFLVLDWTRRGYLTQINKGSILGGFGETVRHTAINLLSRNLGTVLASDAHSPFSRTTSMSEAFGFITNMFSLEYAVKLMITRPREILSGKQIRSGYKKVAINNDVMGD